MAAGRSLPARVKARLRPILESLPVRVLRDVLHRYDAAGGALLASGLAYSALFAIVPTLIFLLGISGLIVADPFNRATLVDTLTTVAPPLRPLLTQSLEQLSAEATSVSIVGLIGFAWGSSRFLVALEYALGRILGGSRKRNVLVRNLIGLSSVIVLVAAVLGGMLLAAVGSFVAAFVETVAPGRAVANAIEFVFGLSGVVFAVLALAIVYRFLPPGTPSWRAIVPPSIATAIVLAILSRVFVFLAPRFIGAAAFLGTLATVFAALAWLGLSFQAILLGAAWIRARSERLDGPGAIDGRTGDPVDGPDAEERGRARAASD